VTKTRLEAFSDGVIAIIITIMVLELHPPEHGADLHALRPLLPVFVAYAVSFIFVGIYWNNHHHLLHAAERISGAVMWANLHLLFWLSMVPFVTGWIGQHYTDSLPSAAYGLVLLMCGLAFTILLRALLAVPGGYPRLAAAVGGDLKGKLSLLLYGAAIGLAFANHWIADAIYVAVALMWLVPDTRIERELHG
jgi:uncharacterized membrane protein